MENILDIVSEYSKRRKILDFDAIKKISSIIINMFNIKNVKNITFNFRPFGNTHSEFNYTDEQIILYKNAIRREINRKSRFKITSEFDDITKYYSKNLQILFLLLHEFEHAKQMSHGFENSLEQTLCTSEIAILSKMKATDYFGLFDSEAFKNAIKISRSYDSNYHISILERLANIKALEFVNRLIDSLDMADLKELEHILLIDTMIRSYKSSEDSPTLRFFENMGYRMQLDIPNSYDERFKYGFKLSNEEYQINKDYIKSKER